MVTGKKYSAVISFSPRKMRYKIENAIFFVGAIKQRQ